MKKPTDRRVTYVVTLGQTRDLDTLAPYLSSLGVADCDVLILDDSPRSVFDENRRVLRWVGRHVAIGATQDVLRAAMERAACEKVIVASDDVRYTRTQLDQLCELLDLHEVVEPHQYLDPMPWWCAIEAGRMLVHRGVDAHPDHGATYGFRRSSLRALRGLNDAHDEPPVRRLIACGAEVHAAADVFVQRHPPVFASWLAERPRQAMDDFAMPVKTAFFFALGPLLILLALLGGAKIAGSYASVIAFASVALAIRGRSGASAYFPLHSCLCAPLWLAERAVSVYWGLGARLRAPAQPAAIPSADAPTPDRHTHTSSR